MRQATNEATTNLRRNQRRQRAEQHVATGEKDFGRAIVHRNAVLALVDQELRGTDGK